MELKFRTQSLRFLEPVAQEVRNSEQTQEIRLTDGMPDIGQVVSAWGQPVLRSKEWNAGEIAVSGGMMVWVIYVPEGEEKTQVVTSWVPFSMRWDLPAADADGSIRISCLPRFVDARTVSPRKMILRCGLGVQVQALAPQTAGCQVPEETDRAELLRVRHSVRLGKAASEKVFLLDEALNLPESAPKPEKLVYCTLDGMLTDCRVLTDKLVFRGVGSVHMLCCSDGGQLCSYDFELPFSQYTELGEEFTGEAKADIWLTVTSMEPELTEDGTFRLKCAMAAQYLITDREELETAEDAYCTDRELGITTEEMILPSFEETGKENLYADQTIPAQAGKTVDVRFLPDYPVTRRTEDQQELAFPGLFQVLYYGDDGALQGATARWEGKIHSVGKMDSLVQWLPRGTNLQAVAGMEGITVKADLDARGQRQATRRIPMVTKLEPGEIRTTDGERPSLILQRFAGGRLWDVGKQNHAPLSAIRSANQLEGEPEPGQILLIPVR